ncbi:hypothetical protein DNL40_09930 [Xylanimonas oleitrophica]|uniref:Uncharacterized protein n=1 Tax=Xylanimonas oleitrophica TaxID=2607479 RepID=A0A2W5YEQ9_9MICO|nr:hypothetical protein DNL40_09930 [Xylanimonas oleitrophica]
MARAARARLRRMVVLLRVVTGSVRAPGRRLPGRLAGATSARGRTLTYDSSTPQLNLIDQADAAAHVTPEHQGTGTIPRPTPAVGGHRPFEAG